MRVAGKPERATATAGPSTFEKGVRRLRMRERRGLSTVATASRVTAAAIGNAVYHATGKRIRDLPITIDTLLE